MDTTTPCHHPDATCADCHAEHVCRACWLGSLAYFAEPF